MIKYRNNNIIIVMLSSVILLLSAALIYFVFFYNDSDYTVIDTNSKDDYTEITDDETINIFKELIANNKLENVAKLEKNILDFNNLSNREKTDIGYYGIIDNIPDAYSSGISMDLISDYFNNTFKDNIDINKEDGIYCNVCDEKLFIYDSDNDKYIYNEDHLGHGGLVVENYYSKIIDIKNKNDIYVVTEVKLWHKFNESTGGDFLTKGYDSYSNALEAKNPLFEIEDSNFDISKSIYYYVELKLYNNFDVYVNSMDKYIYTFEKVGSKYLLSSFEYKKI